MTNVPIFPSGIAIVIGGGGENAFSAENQTNGNLCMPDGMTRHSGNKSEGWVRSHGIRTLAAEPRSPFNGSGSRYGTTDAQGDGCLSRSAFRRRGGSEFSPCH